MPSRITNRDPGAMILSPSYREFFWLLVRRDLKVRYAGSTLGGLWNLIHPLMMIAVYMTIFSSFLGHRYGTGEVVPHYGGLDYGVHLCAGLIPWLLFSDVLMRSVNVMIENNNFLKKVSFPPIVLFASVYFNALLINGAGFLCFLGILTALGKTPPLAALAGLAVMALLGLVAVGLGLILAGLNVFFRDTFQIVTVVMQFLFWFNPIVYQREPFLNQLSAGGTVDLSKRIVSFLLLINPFERFITACQWLMGYKVVVNPPTVLDWAIVLLLPPAMLLLGRSLFRRMLPDIRDCL